jgi:hypothetical protein
VRKVFFQHTTSTSFIEQFMRTKIAKGPDDAVAAVWNVRASPVILPRNACAPVQLDCQALPLNPVAFQLRVLLGAASLISVDPNLASSRCSRGSTSLCTIATQRASPMAKSPGCS